MKKLLFALALLPGAFALAQTTKALPPLSVLTQRYDNARSGANLREHILNTSNVNVKSFGKLWSKAVDAEVYAQPLYVPNLNIGGKTRNVLFVATVHNSVYAFDADDPEAQDPLWTRNFGPAIPVSDIGGSCGSYRDINLEAGIIGTPVIDPKSNTMYFVVRNKNADKTYHQYLYALDIATGKNRPNAPVEIRATYKGTGAGNKDGVLSFDPLIQNQRASLLLLKGTVYISWASYCDTGDYHGWILGYDANTLGQTAIFNTTPGGWAGGVWQSGTGMSADAKGNLYMAVGNGTFNLDQPNGADIGNSFIKLGTEGVGPGKLTQLKLLDSFTPRDQADLLRDDADFGSTGALLLHDERLMIGGNKRGNMYVVPMDGMGGYTAGKDNPAAQVFSATGGGHLHGTPIYWKSDAKGPLVYAWGESDPLKARRLLNNKLEEQPVAQTPYPAPGGMPGGFMSVSAWGGTPGTGILWASLPADRDANHATVPGVLRAFDAEDVTKELWNSLQNAPRDDIGNFPKFCTPVVANGKVFMATFSNAIVCYGLNPPSLLAPPTVTPNGGKPGASVLLAGEAGAQLRYTLDGSEPTRKSALFTKPFTVKDNGIISVRAFKKGRAPSPVVQAFFAGDPLVGSGDGLSGTYFATKDLTGQSFSRVDKTVDTRQAPAEIKVPNGGPWSARWTGQIEAQYDATYTFTTISDDGVRVWIGDKVVIDDWGDHAPTEDSGRVELKRGQKLPIKIEYYNGAGDCDIHLFWQTPFTPRVLVPGTQLSSK